MSVWEQLPNSVREKCAKLAANPEFGDAIKYLVEELATAQGKKPFPAGSSPFSPAAASLSTAPSSTAPKPNKSALTFPVSQVLPARKSVQLQVTNTSFTTVNNADGAVLSEGDFKNYNVFLNLPMPKRSPKPQQYVVLTSLNGQSVPFIFLVGSENSEALVSALKKNTKYSSVDLVENSAMVTAYVGAREGTLYFLKDFLFFGFKKPLMLAMLAEVESVSFTLVTSRTFNLVVKLLDDSQHEFEKIDHKYYEMILEYINANDLNDESLAEERKAKRQRTSELEEASKLADTNIEVSDDEEDEFQDNGGINSSSEDEDGEEDGDNQGNDNDDEDDDDEDDDEADDDDEAEEVEE